jgi:hypothetical protein
MSNQADELRELLKSVSPQNNNNQNHHQRRQIQLLNRHNATHQGIDSLMTLVNDLRGELAEVRIMQSATMDSQSMTNSTLLNMKEAMDYHINISEYTSDQIVKLTDITKNGLNSLMKNGLSVRNKCLPPKTPSEYMSCLKDLIIILISVYYFIGYVYFQVCSTIMKVTHTSLNKLYFLNIILIPLIETALLLIMFWFGTLMGQVGSINMVHRQTIGAFAISIVRIICHKTSYLLKSSIIYISDDLIGVYSKSGLQSDAQVVKDFAVSHMPRIEMLENLNSLSKYTLLPNSTHIYHSSGLASAVNTSTVLFNRAGQVVSESTMLSKAGEHFDVVSQIVKENGNGALTKASSIIGSGISSAMSYFSSQVESAPALTGGSHSRTRRSLPRSSKNRTDKSRTKRRTNKKHRTNDWNEINQYLARESIQDSARLLIVLLSTILDLSKMYTSLSDEGRQKMDELIVKKYSNMFSLKELYGFDCLAPLQSSLQKGFFEVYDKPDNISFLM